MAPTRVAIGVPRRRPRRYGARHETARRSPVPVVLALAFAVPLAMATLGLPVLLPSDGSERAPAEATPLRPVRSGALPGEPAKASVLDPAPPPTLAPPTRPAETSVPSPTVAPKVPETTYVVRPGDQLRYIAARNGVSLASVLAVNAIADPDRLAVGQEIVLPPPASERQDGSAATPGALRDGSTMAAASWPPAGSRTVSAVVTGYADGGDGGAVGSTTASGTRTHWGAVAADLPLYPFGTRLVIEGFDGVVFAVEDTGDGVHGDAFDVWFPDAASAVQFGVQRRQVTVLPPGR